MSLSPQLVNDCELLGIILTLPNIRARARFIQRFLRPSDQHRLCEHIGKIVSGKVRSHQLNDGNSFRTVTKILTPHKRTLKRVLKRVQDKRARKNFDLKSQRGGALFSVIIAGLIPLVADLIIRAATKK